MKPRLKSSKKWTEFPLEYRSQIETVFKDNFQEASKNGKIIIEGRIYPEEVIMRVGYLQNGRLQQANFEASVQYDHAKKDALEKIHTCIDATASMMLEYFENANTEEGIDFPKIWTEYNMNEQEVYLQFTTVNTQLESMADQILGEELKELIIEDDEEIEDALEYAEVDPEILEKKPTKH